jgi:hypothetical protein
MDNKNLTIFQRLNTVFNPDGSRQPKVNTVNKYSLSNNTLIQTQDKEEYDRAKLQARQSKYLGNVWRRVDGEMFQKSLHYEVSRIGSYSDFENMEFYPQISAALDVIMEESTTVNDKGRILNVYSNSKRVKSILEDLFFNRLDIQTSLPMWTRNTVKYGDNFVFMNIDGENGIVGGKQMPTYEMERNEGDLQSKVLGSNGDSQSKTKFLWRTANIELNYWQVAHFRLLGDDRRLPYGTSMLEKARRIWKQLILSEDAMLIYRITRAPERRVYKIYVGNIDDEDVPSYVDEIASRFKRMPIVDPKTGQIDLKFNQMANDQDFFIPVRSEDAPNPIDTLPGACIALDTRIPLLDGRTLELQEIIKEWNNGNRDLWVYSCNPETGELAPGMITWAGNTRKDAEVIKITLDNGESIITTPDHKWVHRTKGFVEANDLLIDDSLMPFYRDTKRIKTNVNGDYERIWDSHKEEWVFTHRMVTDSLNNKGVIKEFTFDEKYLNSVKNVRHHKDHNRFNNNPKNLVWMNGGDHIQKNSRFDVEANYNHKIISIEWLVDRMDTGTITVDGDEIYHNYHTFATESGVFIKNSNLDAIADIEYLQRNLFTALRVPKSFLNYEDANGEGKNLALQDIRFTRTINRVQQSMIQELNKIAIIHLFLIGLEDEIDNFTLTLNNPSTQADSLRIENQQMKITLLKDAVSDTGNGFAAMSMTRAKREILGWSDDEIKQDLLEQRMEKAASAELANTNNVIKYTGVFDEVDRVYGDINLARTGGGESTEGGDETGGESGGGGGFGGGGFGGEIDFGEGGDEVEDTEGGDTEGGDTEGGDTEGGDETSVEPTEESKKKKEKLIIESMTDKLIRTFDNKEKLKNSEPIKIYNKSVIMNETINAMISDINNMIDKEK